MQVAVLEPSDPIFWPLGTGYPHFPPGSINVVDCQDGTIDFRNRNLDLTMEYGTLILSRCLAIYGDMEAPWVSTSFLYDTTQVYPCNVCCSLNLHACAVRATTCCSW